MTDEPRAVLVIGVFGAGKSSAIEEMAEILEHRGESYAALDVDWLGWFYTTSDDYEARHTRVQRDNVATVVANYLSAGVRSFLLARSIDTQDQLDALRAALPMPLAVVRLTVPLQTVRERLGTAVTRGRAVDLRDAIQWFEAGEPGVGLEDFALDGERPIDELAQEILDRIDWN